LIRRAEDICNDFSPRSLSAIELVETIRLEIRNGTPERALDDLISRLAKLMKLVEQERREQAAAVVAGMIFQEMLPIYGLTRDFQYASPELRTLLFGITDKGEHYEIYNPNHR
jgi:hypothetical protein